MELSPQKVRAMSFSTIKRGYDTAEVNSFVAEVALALEAAQNETRAMEARARAAVARLQELSQAPGGIDGDGAVGEDGGSEPAGISASVDEAETISRTLLLAQRTADTTVAEAEAEAERMLAGARDDAASSLDQAREMADQLVEDARVEARRAGEGERVRVDTEVQALKARRDFLESDVDTLESFLIEQRERLRESASVLADLVERVPGGLGAMRRPSLSAAGEDPTDVVDEDDTQPYERPGAAGEEDESAPDDTAFDDLDGSGDDADAVRTDAAIEVGPASAVDDGPEADADDAAAARDATPSELPLDEPRT